MAPMQSRNRLTDEIAAGITRPGKYADGGGLYLMVRPSGAKVWSFLYSFAGKRREMTLFSAADFRIYEARREAAKHRRAIAKGVDPLEKRRARAEPKPRGATFGKVAEDYLAAFEPTWPNANHRRQWRSSLTVHCAPIWERAVGSVEPKDIVAILGPIWLSTPESAQKLRYRIARVFNFAQANELYRGENPARREGNLEFLLPRQPKKTGHYRAMPFERIPAFVTDLQAAEATSARALEFLILTGLRAREVLGAQWEEVDLAAAVWTVPGSRMKAHVQHRVPLSNAAMALLHGVGICATGLIFPGATAGKPLSNMAMLMLLRRRRLQYHVHGFRSSFRDWAGDMTDFAREVAEAALAHQVGTVTERAYRRRDALEKRRALMEAWGVYCTSALR